MKLRCLHWPASLRPNWRFTGPFTSTANDSNSSVPILFLGNTLDPMTPISNAHEMVKAFPHSVVVEQNARGHCALGNGVPSPQVVSLVRKYLQNGTLPAPGTVCDAECNVFDGSCPDMDLYSAVSGSSWWDSY